MPVLFETDEAVGYWILLDAFGFTDVDGFADGAIPLRYLDADYNIIQEVTADALSAVPYQIAGEYGLTFKEDANGKSWFLLNTHSIFDQLNQVIVAGNYYQSYTYHLVRLALDGQSFEEDHSFVLDVTAIGGSDLTIPMPFVDNSAYNAAFAIAEDGTIWMPTPDGAQAVDPDTGSLTGSPIAWPETVVPFSGDSTNPGISHAFWILRGFQGGRSGILAQVQYSDVTTAVVMGVPNLTCNDVRWRWYHLPWGDTAWTLWAERVITDNTQHPFSYWIPGGPFGGTPPGAPMSPWDFFYDIGGCSPTTEVFCGAFQRALTTANMFERDYIITQADGLQIRPEDTNFRRRRPARLVDNRSWVVAAPSQFATQVHQRLNSIASTGGSPTEPSVGSGTVITAPQSQWRGPAVGPA